MSGAAAAVAERFEQAQADLFWVPPDVRVVSRPELVYCASARDLVLFNTVCRVRPEGHDVRALVEEVCEAHRGRTSRWIVRRDASAALAPALRRARYVRWRTCELRALSLERWSPTPPPALCLERVQTLEGLRCWHEANRAAFSRTDPLPNARDQTWELRRCTEEGARVIRLLVRDPDTGQAVSSAAVTLAPALGVAFLWAGGTHPAWRGRGAYSALTQARIEVARQAGLEWVGLFAVPSTSAPIVARRGFALYDEIDFWDRDP